MLDAVIRFSIKNKLIVALCTLLLLLWGGYALKHLPVDAVPDITNNQVQIITNAPTLASQEVEQFITAPIEQSVANLPGLEEIRSISRFGLSVVTVVFEDKTDIYFARQLIQEKLREATENIPDGLGTPELAPVSTGLGEIYQYILHPKKGSEHKYTAMDLRTLQDWVVARQLYGTPGVAEVNSFGGQLKQYEVAVDPNRLKAMQVNMAELIRALERNNENTGGAYIDQKPHAYFIRGVGLISSMEDIGKIVIKSTGGVPVLVKDVARVGTGSATRYGAMTRNGANEVVGGIVMMLKGANSAEVVQRVRDKMELIRKSLPADVSIEPFLDRTDLVDRAMGTVKKNLVEGALIVIFVLVLFLGNLRAGLIVASAIPLAMLFALGMMQLTGVSANLMSLGAIDFGLIVDGAVIIVEATLHHLGLRKSTQRLSQQEMDEEVFLSASKIRSSAAFGELIILMVYIPILTLTGIEGKMFRPMAQTVGFAIVGALILSLTYIPMMCALCLPRVSSPKRTLADRLMAVLQRFYHPLLQAALRSGRAVLAAAMLLLLLALYLFSRTGGEFLPQLQEGDYAFHCILPQGSSLSQSIETSMQASRVIRSFPEVKEVIGKTGSAEVPTDPMPPEATDLIIVLKDRKEWKTTKDYNELARLIGEKLEVIPGVFFEVNQPIQMRFNELMTGVRQDVAVKIFGENLDTLQALAPRIAGVIASVKGTTAPQIERAGGLPQITITYDRGRVAAYGLNIRDINQVVSAAFAGQRAGVIFENERKFDLVVRLDSAFRSSIQDVAGLYIPSGNDQQIPLSQVAEIGFKEGPAQISRESARRRLVIGFNVSGRDVQSVVKDIRQQLESRDLLPEGYYLDFGGTFENLEKANARLLIAVPAALLLIFMLLYLTFRSLRQALLIFTAIPMAATGGVFALLLRGMPFSISAGVGFIALFGVAVLNGIVLIGTFNQLREEGIEDIRERIREGARIRLRPVMMTAMVASLGFLPMAVATGAGAEVQKPLATVVIGGLLSATLLTLLVLPVLYLFFGVAKKSLRPARGITLLLLFSCGIGIAAHAQPPAGREASFAQLYEQALTRNPQLAASTLAMQKAGWMSRTAFSPGKTGFFIENEDLRPSDHRGILKIGLSQSMDWPGLYTVRKEALESQRGSALHHRELQVRELRRSLQIAYYTLWYYQSKEEVWTQLDSIYSELRSAAIQRVRSGESAGLDSLAAQARSAEIRAQKEMLYKDMMIQQTLIKALLYTDSLYLPEKRPLARLVADTGSFQADRHPLSLRHSKNIALADAVLKQERRSMLPDFSGRVFTQRLYEQPDPFTGFSLSVGVPVLNLGSHRARVKAAQLEQAYQQQQSRQAQAQLEAGRAQASAEMQRQETLLRYYEQQGLGQARAILDAAGLAYRAGEISFAELSQFMSQAVDIRKNYLEALHQYNLTQINFSYYQTQ